MKLDENTESNIISSEMWTITHANKHTNKQRGDRDFFPLGSLYVYITESSSFFDDRGEMK